MLYLNYISSFEFSNITNWNFKIIEDIKPINEVISAMPIPEARVPITSFIACADVVSMFVNVVVSTIRNPINVPTIPIDITTSEQNHNRSLLLFKNWVSYSEVNWFCQPK